MLILPKHSIYIAHPTCLRYAWQLNWILNNVNADSIWVKNVICGNLLVRELGCNKWFIRFHHYWHTAKGDLSRCIKKGCAQIFYLFSSNSERTLVYGYYTLCMHIRTICQNAYTLVYTHAQQHIVVFSFTTICRFSHSCFLYICQIMLCSEAGTFRAIDGLSLVPDTAWEVNDKCLEW